MVPATSRQTIEKKQGKLSIFVSYFSGTGKRYRMLQEAKRMQQEGADVVIGALSCTGKALDLRQLFLWDWETLSDATGSKADATGRCGCCHRCAFL